MGVGYVTLQSIDMLLSCSFLWFIHFFILFFFRGLLCCGNSDRVQLLSSVLPDECGDISLLSMIPVTIHEQSHTSVTETQPINNLSLNRIVAVERLSSLLCVRRVQGFNSRGFT
jgi:hypothetical protein